MMASKYFSVIEVGCKCCGQLPDKRMLDKMDEIREKFGKPIHASSGFRCVKRNAKIGGSPNSNHCWGLAVDVVRQPDLEKFILANLETLDIWIEDLGSTPTWIHLQVVPPRSGNRQFKP